MDQSPPVKLQKMLGEEKPDFIVRAKRATSLGGSVFLLFFAVFWLIISGLITYFMVTRLFSGGEINYTINGIPKTTDKPGLILLLPAVFDLVGIFLLWASLRGLFSGEAWFAGTSSRLFVHAKSGSRSIDWEQFNGDIEVSGDENLGNVTLAMRTGHWQGRKHRADRYVPDDIQMIQIGRPYEIEAKCRARIKQNDPTPVSPVSVPGGLNL
ncbi:MAG: hypothetical protein HYT46_02085 [Candidatus Vogelbacteria bacterium]|nr:hypothetical protein [Candidatus Vogelbacteria bacterium]